MSEAIKTYWLSKYALSKGIEQVKGETTYAGRIWLRARFNSFKLGRDIHATESEAINAAEAMRANKIKLLQKQIKKLEAMSFAKEAS